MNLAKCNSFVCGKKEASEHRCGFFDAQTSMNKSNQVLFFQITNSILIYTIIHTRLKDQRLCPIGGETAFCCREMFDIINTNKKRFDYYKSKKLEFYLEKVF